MLVKNLAANYLGEIWVTIAQFAILSVYVAYLGLEAFGLIGLHTSLLAIAQLSNLGITPTFNRELSRLSGLPETETQIRSFVRTMEVGYWALCLILTMIAFVLLPPLVRAWINPGSLSPDYVEHIVRLMFVQIGLQLIVGFYTGGLLGLQQHVLMNTLSVAAVTVRLGGAALILAFVSPTLEALFYWLIFATAGQALIMGVMMYRVVPAGPSTVQADHIRRVWRYATGTSGTVVLSVILLQIDKAILSRTLSLTEFGIYTLAATLAMAPSRPITPLSRTLLPRMTQLVAREQFADVARVYHAGCQVASLLILPITAVLILFSNEIVAAAFPTSHDVAAVAKILSVLAWGFGILALMAVPYALTLAYGWVAWGFYHNVVACLVLVPLVLVLVSSYGAIGAAAAWAILTTGYFFLSPYFLHRRILPAEYGNWYKHDVLPPLAASAATALALRFVAPFGNGWVIDVVTLGVVYGLALLASLAALPVLRARVVRTVTTALNRKASP